MLSASVVYRSSATDLAATLARTKAKPAVEKATKAFEEAAARIDTLDDFMADKAVFAYAMKAYGLEDMGYAKGLIRQVLREGVDGAADLANRLPDDRYRQLANAFSFDADGRASFAADAIAATADTYAQVALESSAGSLNEGARLALYFERKAPTITGVWSILADRSLLQVAQGALNLPATISALGIDEQATILSSKLDVAKLQDPTFRAAFLKRFVAAYDVAAAQAQAGENRLVSLLNSFAGGGSS